MFLHKFYALILVKIRNRAKLKPISQGNASSRWSCDIFVKGRSDGSTLAMFDRDKGLDIDVRPNRFYMVILIFENYFKSSEIASSGHESSQY